MKSIKNKIEELKQINLESFDIDTLVAMQSEIKSKQNNLFDEIEKIGHSIKGAKVYKEFYGETKLLPKKKQLLMLRKNLQSVNQSLLLQQAHYNKKLIENCDYQLGRL